MRKDRVLVWVLGVAVLSGLALQAALGVPTAGTTETTHHTSGLDLADATNGVARLQLDADPRPAMVAATHDGGVEREAATLPAGATAEDGVAIAGRVLVVLALIAAVAVTLLVRGSS